MKSLKLLLSNDLFFPKSIEFVSMFRKTFLTDISFQFDLKKKCMICEMLFCFGVCQLYHTGCGVANVMRTRLLEANFMMISIAHRLQNVSSVIHLNKN